MTTEEYLIFLLCAFFKTFTEIKKILSVLFTFIANNIFSSFEIQDFDV